VVGAPKEGVALHRVPFGTQLPATGMEAEATLLYPYPAVEGQIGARVLYT